MKIKLSEAQKILQIKKDDLKNWEEIVMKLETNPDVIIDEDPWRSYDIEGYLNRKR